MQSTACIIWGALCLFAFGCGAERGRASVSPSARVEAPSAGASTAIHDAPVHIPEPPPLSAAELEAATMQALDAAWKAHDVEKLGSAYSVDARVVLPGFPEATGRSAIEEAARSFWAEFPDAKHAWSRAWRTPGVAIVESAWTGTNTGPLPGAKPTLRTAGATALTLTWFAPDGLVREQHIYSDTGSVAMQLGLSHAKGRPFEGLPTSREEHSASGTVVEQANVELVKGGVLRAAGGDWKGFLSWTAEDAEYLDFTQPGSSKGRAAAEKWLHALRANPSADGAVNVWGIEDYVIREFGVAPSESRGAEVLQIRDSKWVRVWSYANALGSRTHGP